MSLEIEKKMYGLDIEAYVKSVEESFVFKYTGPGMIIISQLSDVQEEIERGLTEQARQRINRVKHLVNRYLPIKNA